MALNSDHSHSILVLFRYLFLMPILKLGVLLSSKIFWFSLIEKVSYLMKTSKVLGKKD